jgi:hypothetical protein
MWTAATLQNSPPSDAAPRRGTARKRQTQAAPARADGRSSGGATGHAARAAHGRGGGGGGGGVSTDSDSDGAEVCERALAADGKYW